MPRGYRFSFANNVQLIIVVAINSCRLESFVTHFLTLLYRRVSHRWTIAESRCAMRVSLYDHRTAV